MWLSKNNIHKEDKSAQVGKVTIGGAELGVYTGSERRRVKLYTPGGYVWRPRPGDEILVMKCQDGSDAAIGSPVKSADLNAGEVLISSGGAVIKLKNDGGIEISGRVSIEGSLTVNGTEIG